MGVIDIFVPAEPHGPWDAWHYYYTTW